MSRFERFPVPASPKRQAWDLVDVCIVIGLAAIVGGVSLLSLAAACIVGGATLVGLAVLWPKR